MIIEKYRIVYGVHAACRNGHFKVAKWLFKKIKKIINKDCDIWNKFWTRTINSFPIICKNGDLKIAKWLLVSFYPEIKIDISYIEEAFHNACENGHLEVAQWLLQMKPTINIFSRKNKEAFRSACKNGHLEVVELLLEIKPYICYINITPTIKIPLKITAAVEKNEHDICCICYDYCEIETQCKHSFCNTCIAKWINISKISCPICRQSMENGFNIIIN
jgi:hypothetical protein